MDNVFKRTAAESQGAVIDERMYNFIIGITLCWGFAVNFLMVKYIPPQFALQYGFLPFVIAYFALAFGGIYIFTKSPDPLISFLGYNMVVVPFGFVVNIIVTQYNPSIVIDAIIVTGLVTAAMMVAGSLYPAFFKKIAGTLFIALISVIIIEAIMIFIFKKDYGVIDWIVALIFCGYIGYDWGRAQRIPKTVDNAVDSAAALYMDIINLFIRILRIIGRR